jgi:hypothetical protein
MSRFMNTGAQSLKKLMGNDPQKSGIHFPLRKAYVEEAMNTIFDELTAALTAPGFDWRAMFIGLAGNMLAGVAIGIGIAAGLTIAG